MANTQYGNVIFANAAGILSKGPLRIRAIQFYPKAVTDLIDLNFWDESETTSESFFNASIASGVVTETSGTTLSAASFPATSVVKIALDSGCTAANKTYHLIGTAGNDAAFTVDPVTTLTDETTQNYHTFVYPARPFFNALCQTVTNSMESKWHYFGGVWVPNLILEAISTDAYALIYFD
jgi:hypothetical protein